MPVYVWQANCCRLCHPSFNHPSNAPTDMTHLMTKPPLLRLFGIFVLFLFSLKIFYTILIWVFNSFFIRQDSCAIFTESFRDSFKTFTTLKKRISMNKSGNMHSERIFFLTKVIDSFYWWWSVCRCCRCCLQRWAYFVVAGWMRHWRSSSFRSCSTHSTQPFSTDWLVLNHRVCRLLTSPVSAATSAPANGASVFRSVFDASKPGLNVKVSN